MENIRVKSKVMSWLKITPVLLIILFVSLFTTGCGESEVIFKVTASIDGEKWTGPIEFSLHDKGLGGLTLFEGSSVDYQTSRDELLHGNAMYTGKSIFVYKSGGPEGARLAGIQFTLSKNDNMRVNESVTTPFYALDVDTQESRGVYVIRL